MNSRGGGAPRKYPLSGINLNLLEINPQRANGNITLSNQTFLEQKTFTFKEILIPLLKGIERPFYALTPKKDGIFRLAWNEKKCAFTLAEVLITLGIIGIVAAMTLPGVITDYRKKSTAKQLQQAYNFLQQTVQFAQNDYGDMKNWECFLPNACTDEEFAKKYIIPYFKDPNIKTSRSLTSAGYKDFPKGLNGETTMTGWSYCIKTPQGYYYLLTHYTLGDGTRTTFGVGIDINGEAPPNVMGRDIFRVTYGYNISAKNHYRLQMYNYYNKDRDELLRTNCNKNYLGEYCGAVIEMDGWEIKDDDPW